MDGKKSRIQILTLVLCAVLLGLNLWQLRRILNLQKQTRSVPDTVTNQLGLPEELSEQLEAAKKTPDVAWAECARIDPATRTMTLCIYLERLNAGDTYSVNVRYGMDGQSGVASLHRLPGGALGGEFTLPLEADGGLEIAQSDGTVLFRRGCLTDLLPVQLAAYPDLLLAEGMAYLRECRIELTTPQGGCAEVAEVEGRVDWNGETIFEGTCGDISQGLVKLEPWTHPFTEGDTLEYHFLCTDRYGLRYDFTLFKRPAEELEDGPERCRPVLLWPEE